MNVKKYIVFAILALVLANVSCSLWIGDKKIIENHKAPSTDVGVLAMPEELPTLVPTLHASPTLSASVTAMQSLNVRSGPGRSNKVIGYLYNGYDIALTGNCLNGWAEIIWEDGTAWVGARYLSENKCSR